MKKMTNWIMALVFTVSVGGSAMAITAPSIVYAADDTCNQGFLGFPAWYRGLIKDAGTCDLKSPSDFGDNGLSTFIWIIALNVIDIGLMLVGYLSVGFIIYGGFLLMTGRGKPAEIAEGQMMIRNAVIGLAISFGSVAVVNFIVNGVINQ